jgi:esterase/lipase superfamily enzyme
MKTGFPCVRGIGILPRMTNRFIIAGFVGFFTLGMSVLFMGCTSTRTSTSSSTAVSDSQDVLLFYATNRAYRKTTDPEKFFGNTAESPASRTHYGVYPVKTDLRGEKFQPGNLRIIGSKAWTEQLRVLALENGRPKRTIAIYIHGYNNDFTDAASAMARLTSGFGDRIVPVIYSWPSRKKLLGYTSDEREVERSAEYFADFLSDLLVQLPDARIAIIAHSMGNRVLVEGLERLTAKLPDDKKDQKISAVALFAADVDRSTYADRYVQTVRKRADRIYVYASAKDKALAASRRVHGSEPRLGQTYPSPPYNDSFSETIDATDAGSDFLGHGYFSGNRAVISDLVYAVEDGIPAWRRAGLKPMPNLIAKKYYWLMVD